MALDPTSCKLPSEEKSPQSSTEKEKILLMKTKTVEASKINEISRHSFNIPAVEKKNRRFSISLTAPVPKKNPLPASISKLHSCKTLSEEPS